MVWTARAAWIVLPITIGAAINNMIQPWSRASEVVAAVLLWSAWFAGVVALLAPRPWGYTVLRVVAPATVAIAIAAAWSSPWPTSVVAIVTATFALFTSLSSAVAHAAAASTAYGPERRFPLRVPLALLAGPLPVSVAAIVAAVVCGPLLLANRHLVAGIAALALGAPALWVLTRSLTALDRRWIVLVPAGLVVVDPMTFPDPVLLPREHIASMRISPPETVKESAREIRVGGAGPLVITCHEAGMFPRRTGRGRESVQADRLRVSPLRPDAVLRAAGAHRITVA